MLNEPIFWATVLFVFKNILETFIGRKTSIKEIIKRVKSTGIEFCFIAFSLFILSFAKNNPPLFFVKKLKPDEIQPGILFTIIIVIILWAIAIAFKKKDDSLERKSKKIKEGRRLILLKRVLCISMTQVIGSLLFLASAIML